MEKNKEAYKTKGEVAKEISFNNKKNKYVHVAFS